MTIDSDMHWQTNPFSARFIRPGAIEYLFTAGQSAAELVEKLRANAWRGQIVGPHGSGKSTLLATLERPLEAAGRRVLSFALHDGQDELSANWIKLARNHEANLLVVDGYEQLRRLSRIELSAIGRWRGWGLLVTAHQDVGFPQLYRTTSSPEVAQAVVERLLPGCEATISRQTVAEHFAAAGGNVREALFSLYDEYARCQPSRPA